MNIEHTTVIDAGFIKILDRFPQISIEIVVSLEYRQLFPSRKPCIPFPHEIRLIIGLFQFTGNASHILRDTMQWIADSVSIARGHVDGQPARLERGSSGSAATIHVHAVEFQSRLNQIVHVRGADLFVSKVVVSDVAPSQIVCHYKHDLFQKQLSGDVECDR